MNAINITKEYLNFSSAHFLIFNGKERESLHGHNYRVRFMGQVEDLIDDMVFDFLKIKPLIKSICDSLDGKILIAKDNTFLKIISDETYYTITHNELLLIKIPQPDIILLPIKNTSAELLAQYISHLIDTKIYNDYQFIFNKTIVEVEETKGQSAIFENRKKGV